MHNPIRLVSVSGGKDSTATLLVALERHPLSEIQAVFADTGNEHPLTYDYVRYLSQATGVTVKWLKEDFTDWWWKRRDYVRDVWPTKVNKDGTVTPAEVIDRVLAVFEKGPTGNPYLDLCIIKGRFPSRMAQFCTQFLKTEPLTQYAMELIDQVGAVESWQGVRADESPSRAKLAERVDEGAKYSIYRPILKWNVQQVFEQHAKFGIEPNPLYKLGMGRVGCMPCINAKKDEVLEIAKRFPEQIDRIAEWEIAVTAAAKKGLATMFHFDYTGEYRTAEAGLKDSGVRAVVEWSKTSRGKSNFDLFRQAEEPAMCSSVYGLCE